MDTITFRPGDSTIMTFMLKDGSERPVDLTGATAHVEIRTGTACVRLELTPTADGFEWALNDETMQALAPGIYAGTFRIAWPDGLKDRADFRLKVERGCA